MRTATEVSNTQDIIDSRDVIARIDEMEAELRSAFDDEKEGNDDAPDAVFKEWVEAAAENVTRTLQDACRELCALRNLADECEGYGDWAHGETLIRGTYFQTYAQDLADDLGCIDAKAGWPCNCIDWEKAADELKADYMCVDFDG